MTTFQLISNSLLHSNMVSDVLALLVDSPQIQPAELIKQIKG